MDAYGMEKFPDPAYALPAVERSQGDIGYATFRTSADRAVCSLELKDFYFPREPETSARPAAWKMKVEETRGQRVTFLYDRGEPVG